MTAKKTTKKKTAKKTTKAASPTASPTASDKENVNETNETNEGGGDIYDAFNDPALNEAYNEAPKKTEFDDDIPEGTYQVVVADAKVDKSSNGTPRISFFLKIIGPTQLGRHFWKNANATPEGMKYIRPDLELLQYRGEIRELPARIGELKGRVIEVTIKKGGARNDGGHFLKIYLNKFIAEDIDTMGGAASGSGDGGAGDSEESGGSSVSFD